MAREAKNMTQKSLADAIGKDEAVLSKWETGKNTPQRANLALLAEALSVNLSWLRTGELTPVAGDFPQASILADFFQVFQEQKKDPSDRPASPTRVVLESVLKDDLRGLGERIPQMTDDEIAELATAIRKALAKQH